MVASQPKDVSPPRHVLSWSMTFCHIAYVTMSSWHSRLVHSISIFKIQKCQNGCSITIQKRLRYAFRLQPRIVENLGAYLYSHRYSLLQRSVFAFFLTSTPAAGRPSPRSARPLFFWTELQVLVYCMHVFPTMSWILTLSFGC